VTPWAGLIVSMWFLLGDVPGMRQAAPGSRVVSSHLRAQGEGWPLALAVTAASVSDKAGARLVTRRLIALLAIMKLMWADAGYNGKPLRDWMMTTAGITLEIVARTSPHSFQVLKRRWVVERTFGWLMRYRRLARTTSAAPSTTRPWSGGPPSSS
jgi:putative transposase